MGSLVKPPIGLYAIILPRQARLSFTGEYYRQLGCTFYMFTCSSMIHIYVASSTIIMDLPELKREMMCVWAVSFPMAFYELSLCVSVCAHVSVCVRECERACVSVCSCMCLPNVGHMCHISPFKVPHFLGR